MPHMVQILTKTSMGNFTRDHLVAVNDEQYQSLKNYSIQKYKKQNYVAKALRDILENFFNKQAK